MRTEPHISHPQRLNDKVLSTKRISDFLRHRFAALAQPKTIGAKLQTTIVMLMLGSLAISIVIFVVSTHLTQSRLLQAETEAEAQQAVAALLSRANAMTSAAQLLAADPQIAQALQEDTEETLQTLNARAVLVRDRFSAGLIQIYNAEGHARANLLISTLYRESSLLDQVTPGSITVQYIAGRVVLLSRQDLADGLGTVITGIDLERELNDLVRQYRLMSDVGLIVQTPSTGDSDAVPSVSTWNASSSKAGEFPFTVREGYQSSLYSQHRDLVLGDSQTRLILVRATEDIRSLTNMGLVIMILSMTITTALLLLGSLRLMRAIARPIHILSTTAAAVASGDFSQQADSSSPATHPNTFLSIGRNDEISQLTDAFNQMIDDLQNLYSNLEARVAARTQELATIADVARTISSSLDLNTILRQATQLIHRRLNVDITAVYLMDDEMEAIILQQIVGDNYPLNKGDVVMLASDTSLGMAARLHTTVVIKDIERSAPCLPTTWSPTTRAVAVTPILQGSDVMGVLELQSATPDFFTPEQTNLLSTVCDQMAAGIQNARRYESEKRRRRFTEVLELTGRTLTGNLDMQQLPRRALSSLLALISYERGALWMIEGNRMLPVAQYGYIDERPLRRKHLSIQTDIYARFANDKAPIIIEDVAACDWKPKLWLAGDRSWMGVPIITAKGQLIGLVSLATSEPGDFAPDDAIWVQTFASQVGIAMENAHLYAEIAILRAHRTDTETLEPAILSPQQDRPQRELEADAV